MKSAANHLLYSAKRLLGKIWIAEGFIVIAICFYSAICNFGYHYAIGILFVKQQVVDKQNSLEPLKKITWRDVLTTMNLAECFVIFVVCCFGCVIGFYIITEGKKIDKLFNSHSQERQ